MLIIINVTMITTSLLLGFVIGSYYHARAVRSDIDDMFNRIAVLKADYMKLKDEPDFEETTSEEWLFLLTQTVEAFTPARQK